MRTLGTMVVVAGMVVGCGGAGDGNEPTGEGGAGGTSEQGDAGSFGEHPEAGGGGAGAGGSGASMTSAGARNDEVVAGAGGANHQDEQSGVRVLIVGTMLSEEFRHLFQGGRIDLVPKTEGFYVAKQVSRSRTGKTRSASALRDFSGRFRFRQWHQVRQRRQRGDAWQTLPKLAIP